MSQGIDGLVGSESGDAHAMEPGLGVVGGHAATGPGTPVDGESGQAEGAAIVSRGYRGSDWRRHSAPDSWSPRRRRWKRSRRRNRVGGHGRADEGSRRRRPWDEVRTARRRRSGPRIGWNPGTPGGMDNAAKRWQSCLDLAKSCSHGRLHRRRRPEPRGPERRLTQTVSGSRAERSRREVRTR